MESLAITPFVEDSFQEVKAFADQWIGQNYFSLDELKQIRKNSVKNNLNASFCAYDEGKLVGIRLTFAPGDWTQRQRGLTPAKWDVSQDQVAYFKSLFIHGDYQGKGLGKTLSTRSLEALGKMGAKAVVCHSWLESPGNSSQIYLRKMGFGPVSEYKEFWNDYGCVRCDPSPCGCTASEMIKYL